MSEPYGLMFHHFCGGRHVAGQGAITADEFAAIIEHAGPGNILSPDDWIEAATGGGLREGQTCITFDDALRCQYEIALPVLRDYRLKAFWFVYSSIFDGNEERLEIYRYFRTTAFADIKGFYDAFRAALDASPHGAEAAAALSDFRPSAYLDAFPFYSDGDRTFRFLRDRVLGEAAYFEVMDAMVMAWRRDHPGLGELLWMDDAALAVLRDEGHEVGLHSYTHPTAMGGLPAERQRQEYQRNRDHLSGRLGIRPRTMSHPCNSYNADTLAIMRDFGIEIGFCSNRGAVARRSLYELPREDHANVLAVMRARS